MHKRLAILAVFLVVAGASFPSPRKTPQPEADPGASDTHDSQSQQPSTARSMSSMEPSNTQTFNDYGSEKTDKDGWDKAAVLANYILKHPFILHKPL